MYDMPFGAGSPGCSHGSQQCLFCTTQCNCIAEAAATCITCLSTPIRGLLFTSSLLLLFTRCSTLSTSSSRTFLQHICHACRPVRPVNVKLCFYSMQLLRKLHLAQLATLHTSSTANAAWRHCMVVDKSMVDQLLCVDCHIRSRIYPRIIPDPTPIPTPTPTVQGALHATH